MNPNFIRQAFRSRRAWTLSRALLLAACCGTPIAYADSSATFSVLHNFNSSEGSVPYGSLLQGVDGRFYGNTAMGGNNNVGTVYAVNGAGVLTVLHHFSGSDGASPVGSLAAAANGTLYGVTEFGGSNNTGTVFSITPDGQFTLLYSFSAWTNSANADGIAPRGGLTLGSDGNFYGTTTRGGSNDAGTLFRITPTGLLTSLYSFNAFNSSLPDGAMPTTPLVIGGDGRFYGTTSVGGIHYSGTLAPGTLFTMGLDGTFSAVHSFTSSTDGASPSGLAPANDGSLYGATSIGGINGSGTLFKTTAQGDITTLYSFSPVAATATGLQLNSEGAFPVSGIVVGNDGTLYGGTAFGGTGSGTLFTLAPDGTLTVLHQFSALGGGGTNSDGSAVLNAPIRASDGNLYGVTAWGGSNGVGVIYKLTMPALPTVTLKLASSQITSGSSTSLSWTTSGADSCAASNGLSGSLADSGSMTVTPTATTTYTVSCRNVSGSTPASATLTVNDGSSSGGTDIGAGADNGNTGSGTGMGDTPSKSGGGGAMPLWLMVWGALAFARRRRCSSGR